MKKTKDLPLWVRSGHGNKKNGRYHWEYQKDRMYYAHGFYHTKEEAHQACIEHQEMIAKKMNNKDVHE